MIQKYAPRATAPLHRITRMACRGLLTASAAAVAHAHAAETASQVEVTASPIVQAQRVDEFGSLSTDVGEAQIRELNALDLSAALRRTPGVTVSRFNPVGSFGGDEGGAVYVRGLGASRPGSELKTFVDGIPFYMPVWNHALLDLLPVQGMSSISVLKGPQPQAFGNTLAAIELTPRRALQKGWQAQAQLSGGSFNTLAEQAAGGARVEGAEFTVVQGHAESNGHRDFADGRLDNGMVRGSLEIGAHWQVDALVLAADNRVSDPGVEGQPDTRTGEFITRGVLASVGLSHAHGNWTGRIQVYESNGLGLWLQPPSNVRTAFRTSGLRWQEQASPWSGATLNAGIEVDQMTGSVRFGDVSAFDGVRLRLVSPHVALAQSVPLSEGWTLQPSVGIRAYRHDVFGSASAPHAGLVVAHANNLSLRANVSRGLNFPGLDAALLNAIVPPLAGASPDGWRELSPERMDHQEVGAQWSPARGAQLDLAVFRDDLKNRYVFAFPPAVDMPRMVNLGHYRVQGAELTWQQRWSAAWSSFAGLTWLDPSLADLPYAPRKSLALGLNWHEDLWRLSMDAQAQSGMKVLNRGRADGTTNTAEVAGFVVLNTQLARAFGVAGWRGEAFIQLDNLLDRAYAYRPGYPMPGRSGELGLRVQL